MRVLFIGALPEPITGHSLACRVLLDELILHHDVDVIDLSKGTFVQGVNSWSRIVEVFGIVGRVARLQRSADVIYFTVSESIAGNLKDLLIYLFCWRRLSRMAIHLHGGAGLRSILQGGVRALSWMNGIFLQRLGAVIVLGATHVQIFRGYVADTRIHIVPNFAEDAMFTTPEAIATKFENVELLRVLFLSNLLPGKGHQELLRAFRGLPYSTRSRIELNFAGGFESPEAEVEFTAQIEDLSNVRYHGIVRNQRKLSLFQSAHLFCLPTYYKYEGQPISILEAYAAGCAVITTDHSGIGDVFNDGTNGFEVESRSAEAIAAALVEALSNPTRLRKIADTNYRLAIELYRRQQYSGRLLDVINSLAPSVVGGGQVGVEDTHSRAPNA